MLHTPPRSFPAGNQLYERRRSAQSYEFAELSHWYRWREEKGFLVPTLKPPYSMVIPPPQHYWPWALRIPLQDILWRDSSLRGPVGAWTITVVLPTQNVVERQLGPEGLTRHGIGRKPFAARREWKAKFGGIITKSVEAARGVRDWSRERFTIYEGLRRPYDRFSLLCTMRA